MHTLEERESGYMLHVQGMRRRLFERFVWLWPGSERLAIWVGFWDLLQVVDKVTRLLYGTEALHGALIQFHHSAPRKKVSMI